MNLLIGITIATVAISAMIAIRIVAFESALKERLKPGRSDDCDSAPCFGGCGSAKSHTTSGTTPASERRSAPHAS
jgi:hypothetical protein